MVRNLLISLLLVVGALCAEAADPAPLRSETLRYRVNYKWGLVNKHTANVTVSVRPEGSRWRSTLTGYTQPWADKIMKVRDTLHSTFASNFLPAYYEKRAHEGSHRKLDQVNFKYSGQHATGAALRREWKSGKLTVDRRNNWQADGMVVDMMSLFYYMRQLDLQDWPAGKSIRLTVFSGKCREALTITYHGTEQLEVDDRRYQCYKLSFRFVANNGDVSDDFRAWLTTDSRRLPVRLQGSLPIGSVICTVVE